MRKEDLKLDLWVEETHRDFFATRFRCSRVLFSEKSPFQQVDVVQTTGFGKMLLNDGIVMLSEKDEFIYHEMIAHVPLCLHPCPQRVLIIGGGDGGTAFEVLRHKSVRECHLVEIDKVVIKASKACFPKWTPAFKDKRLKLHIEDGVQFVKNTPQNFDVVLVDSTDPIGPGKALFNKNFYRDVCNLIKNKEALLVLQAQSPFFERETQKFIFKTLKSLFPFVWFYHYTNMVYPGGMWSFALASHSLNPLKDFQAEKASELKGLCYYNPSVHRAAFAQPEFVKHQFL